MCQSPTWNLLYHPIDYLIAASESLKFFVKSGQSSFIPEARTQGYYVLALAKADPRASGVPEVCDIFRHSYSFTSSWKTSQLYRSALESTKDFLPRNVMADFPLLSRTLLPLSFGFSPALLRGTANLAQFVAAVSSATSSVSHEGSELEFFNLLALEVFTANKAFYLYLCGALALLRLRLFLCRY